MPIETDTVPQTGGALPQNEGGVQERSGNGPPSIPGEREFQVKVVKNENAPDHSDKSNDELKALAANPPGKPHEQESNEHRESAINELYVRGEIDYFVDYDASTNTFQVYDSSGKAVDGPVSSRDFAGVFSSIADITLTSLISDIVTLSFDHVMSRSNKDDKEQIELHQILSRTALNM